MHLGTFFPPSAEGGLLSCLFYVEVFFVPLGDHGLASTAVVIFFNNEK